MATALQIPPWAPKLLLVKAIVSRRTVHRPETVL
jgi:hypothetical protein